MRLLRWCQWSVIAMAAAAVALWAPRVSSEAQAPSTDAPAALVVQGGTLIDVRTGQLTPNTTIVVENGRITRVGGAGQVQAPAGAKVVQAAGKFVMPGLWDTHAHTRDYDGDLNLNHGVTSTMDMGNLMDWILALQEAREKEQWIGPRVFAQGMSIGGRLGPHQWAAKTAEEAAWAAKQNVATGANFLKVYQDATPDMVKAAADVAHAAGLNLHGHIAKTDAREAVLAGINALAHGSGLPAATAPPEIAAKIKAGRRGGSDIDVDGPLAYSYMEPAKFDELIALMKQHDVRLEPNLVQVFHGAYPEWDQYELETHRLSMLPELGYIRDDYEVYYRMWFTDFTFDPYPPTPELTVQLRKGLSNMQQFSKRYSEAGGKLFVGTDNYYHAIAGRAVWHEMELLGVAGVAPLKILQAATINPAEFVHQDKNLGTIEPGKLADIIVLGRNPLQDIRNIRSLEQVIQFGKLQPLGYKRDYRVVIPRPYLPVNSSLPRPHLSSVEPAGIPMGTKNVEITIKGTNFRAENRVLFGDIDVPVTALTPTEVKIRVPDDMFSRAGTYKIKMITGGRVHQESDNYQEVMVTFGRRFDKRWNGQKLSTEF